MLLDKYITAGVSDTVGAYHQRAALMCTGLLKSFRGRQPIDAVAQIPRLDSIF